MFRCTTTSRCSGSTRRSSWVQRDPAENLDGESGQATILILGVALILLMLSAVIIGASSVNLQARQLLSEADGAASAAAASAHTAGAGHTVSDAQAADAVRSHLDASEAYSRHHDLHIVSASTTDSGQSVSVELEAQAQLPVLRWVLPAQVPISAESHARITVRR